MKRRQLVKAAAGIAACWVASPSVSAPDNDVPGDEIVLGQSIGLTGPLGELGADITRGVGACFDSLNARGGLNGRRVRLVTLDDGYKPQNTVDNVKQLIGTERAFALLNIMGTPNCAAVLPVIEEAGVPLFFPFTGANVVREPVNPLVFNMRASYADETGKLVQHLATLGIRNFAVVVQNNSFGKDGLAGVHKAVQKYALPMPTTASIETDASNAQACALELAASGAQTVIMITAGKPTLELIRACNQIRRGTTFYALSVMGTQSTIKALGRDGVGVVVTSVVPFPWDRSLPLVREYQAAMQTAGHKEFTFISFESFINARILSEALRRTGRNLSRLRLMDAMEGMTSFKLGGFEIGYGKGVRQASRFVDLTIIGSGGRFTK